MRASFKSNRAHPRSEDEWFDYYLWQLGRQFEKHGQNGPSRLVTIIDSWGRTGDVAAEDRDWLASHCQARRYVKQVPSDTNAFWITPAWGDDSPRAPWEVFEGAAVYYFMQFLHRDFQISDDPKRPRIQRCERCDDFYISKQGKHYRRFCSNACRVRTHRLDAQTTQKRKAKLTPQRSKRKARKKRKH